MAKPQKSAKPQKPAKSSRLSLRERLIANGCSQLSDEDLLALLLGTGTRREGVVRLARRLLDELGQLRALADVHPREVMMISGLAAAKTARLIAAVELGRRICRERWEPGEPFTSSRQVFSHYHFSLRSEKRELFFAVFLDARNRLIGEQEISRGSLVASIVHPREVFRPAIRAAAASVICVHNHPSGDPACSREDVAVTERLYDAGRTIGIELLDHIIIGEASYYSFLDHRIAPFDRPQMPVPATRSAIDTPRNPVIPCDCR